MRDCQPGPLALKAAITSGSRRRETCWRGLSTGGRPRLLGNPSRKRQRLSALSDAMSITPCSPKQNSGVRSKHRSDLSGNFNPRPLNAQSQSIGRIHDLTAHRQAACGADRRIGRAKRPSSASARIRASRKSQSLFASGTRSPRPSPQKRDSRNSRSSRPLSPR